SPDNSDKVGDSVTDRSMESATAAPVLTEEPAFTPSDQDRRPPPAASKRRLFSAITGVGLFVIVAVIFKQSPRLTGHWPQSYDPVHAWLLSAALAALPLLVLLIAMAGLRIKGHIAALAGLTTALAIALVIFRMPVRLAFLATG